MTRALAARFALIILGLCCASAWANGAADPATAPGDPESSIWDLLPARNIVALVLAAAIIGMFVYWMRVPQTNRGFTIHVDEEDITFSGTFPASMEATIIEFLRNDCRIAGSFQVSGHWEERLLIVVVRGEQARPLEQRIRNFLKLNLRPPVK